MPLTHFFFCIENNGVTPLLADHQLQQMFISKIQRHNSEKDEHGNFLGNTWQVLKTYIPTIVAVTVQLSK